MDFRTLVFILILLLVGCGSGKSDQVSAESSPQISSIPDQSCVPFLQPDGIFLFGSHEFAAGAVHLAAPFYCGVREGKRCYYYLQLNTAPTIPPLEDVRCE